ncbi:hypothetical protein HK405_013699, partial [Cladochytrium tenue]
MDIGRRSIAAKDDIAGASSDVDPAAHPLPASTRSSVASMAAALRSARDSVTGTDNNTLADPEAHVTRDGNDAAERQTKPSQRSSVASLPRSAHGNSTDGFEVDPSTIRLPESARSSVASVTTSSRVAVSARASIGQEGAWHEVGESDPLAPRPPVSGSASSSRPATVRASGVRLDRGASVSASVTSVAAEATAASERQSATPTRASSMSVADVEKSAVTAKASSRPSTASAASATRVSAVAGALSGRASVASIGSTPGVDHQPANHDPAVEQPGDARASQEPAHEPASQDDVDSPYFDDAEFDAPEVVVRETSSRAVLEDGRNSGAAVVEVGVAAEYDADVDRFDTVDTTGRDEEEEAGRNAEPYPDEPAGNEASYHDDEFYAPENPERTSEKPHHTANGPTDEEDAYGEAFEAVEPETRQLDDLDLDIHHVEQDAGARASERVSVSSLTTAYRNADELAGKEQPEYPHHESVAWLGAQSEIDHREEGTATEFQLEDLKGADGNGSFSGLEDGFRGEDLADE